ncbi:MAG: TIGR01212 family radical SAM protein [Ruminococcaceae bacterium]|nr:TIGR01212 family radical SAM protein [Oscillospiraceae bacterium]
MKNKNPFENSDTNKRYYTYDCYLKRRFGKKCVKIALDGGFTCPNIDGKISSGGCIFCSEKGSGDHTPPCNIPLEDQFMQGKALVSSKWSDVFYIPYFQAHTNTYAPITVLKEKFDRAIELPDTVGLSISTRPDCLEDDVIEYLSELSEKTYLTVELGLQSANDKTLKLINRGHSYADFVNGYNKLKKKNINVCIHIINGLPGEEYHDMMHTASCVADLHPHALKIHLLYILKNTPLATMFMRGDFKALEREEYVKTVCDQLELLPKDIVIERLTGDGVKDDLIAPLWSTKKTIVTNEIDKELVKRGSFQGFLC